MIALVDARELPNPPRGDGFMGHYVLVTGVDDSRDGYFFKVCRTSRTARSPTLLFLCCAIRGQRLQ